MKEQVEIGPISRSLLVETEGEIDIAAGRQRIVEFEEMFGLPLSIPPDEAVIAFEEGRRKAIREVLDSSPVLKSF